MSHRARNIVKRADVRVGQGRHRTRFAIESFAELRIARQAARQNLGGEACVPGASDVLDRPLPYLRAQRRENFVRPSLAPADRVIVFAAATGAIVVT